MCCSWKYLYPSIFPQVPSVCSHWLVFKNFGYWGSLAPPWNSNSYIPPWSRLMVILWNHTIFLFVNCIGNKEVGFHDIFSIWLFYNHLRSNSTCIFLKNNLHNLKKGNEWYIYKVTKYTVYEIYWCNGFLVGFKDQLIQFEQWLRFRALNSQSLPWHIGVLVCKI